MQRYLSFDQIERLNSDVRVLPLFGDRKPRTFAPLKFSEGSGGGS